MAAGALNPRGAAFLLYHAVIRPPARGDRFAVDATRFRSHLDAVCAASVAGAARPLPLSRWWSGGAGARRALILSFDDGGRSDYETAFPMLAERRLPAVFFVNTASVGTPGYVTWAELREMTSAGMEIQSHAHRHEVLTRLTPERLAASLETSRHILQERLGTPVQFLAVPYGLWNRRVLETALCAGYRALCTSYPARARAGAPLLPRIEASRRASVAQLQGWCRGRHRGLIWRACRDRFLWLPKHILLRCRRRWPAPPLPPAGSRSTC